MEVERNLEAGVPEMIYPVCKTPPCSQPWPIWEQERTLQEKDGQEQGNMKYSIASDIEE